MKYIDMHCHVFPEKIANHAMEILSSRCEYVPQTDGTLRDTWEKQHAWGCNQFVMLNIATSAKTVPVVNDFLIKYNDNRRIFSFGSIYPDYPDYIAELSRLETAGIKGIKFHPAYQNFKIDEKRMYPIYEEIAKRNMIMLFHSGYDPAFDGMDWCDPFRSKKVLEDFKGAKIILAHMGNCLDPKETMNQLLGQEVYFDLSMAGGHMGKEKMEQMIKAHGVDRFLYATDCPWSAGNTVQKIVNSLNILDSDKEKIFYKNAMKLLNIRERDVI